MNRRLKKVLLVLFALLQLAGVSQIQKGLNRDRERLGLTRIEPLENAPPVLAFTTVALGGFRGLISNALWIRASDLQDEDKFFEMVQLADWITKLEPHFVQVWLVQAWNMAYNISVKFKDAPDRWRWVKAGIELLRDDGLRYNPNETLIYRELAWFFQHKMGANLDDAHLYYKIKWRDEMSQIFKAERPNFDELIHPQTDDARQRAKLLREKYKMKPEFMKEVDELYGPMEWRLPEAHAVYWAAQGLEKVRQNREKINQEELITLRRVIYQSMQLSFHRGRLIPNPVRDIDFGPNLEIIPKVSRAYEQAMEEDEKNRDHISRAYRNFLRDAVFFLYTYNRQADAAQWYRYLGKKFPNQTLLDNQTNSLPANLTLEEYAFGRLEEEVRDTSRDKTEAVLEGLLRTSYFSLALGDDDKAAGLERFAQKVWERFQSKTQGTADRLNIYSLAEIKKNVIDGLLDPQRGLADPLANQLRARLGLPPPTNAPPAAVLKK